MERKKDMDKERQDRARKKNCSGIADLILLRTAPGWLQNEAFNFKVSSERERKRDRDIEKQDRERNQNCSKIS